MESNQVSQVPASRVHGAVGAWPGSAVVVGASTTFSQARRTRHNHERLWTQDRQLCHYLPLQHGATLPVLRCCPGDCPPCARAPVLRFSASPSGSNQRVRCIFPIRTWLSPHCHRPRRGPQYTYLRTHSKLVSLPEQRSRQRRRHLPQYTRFFDTSQRGVHESKCRTHR